MGRQLIDLSGVHKRSTMNVYARTMQATDDGMCRQTIANIGHRTHDKRTATWGWIIKSSDQWIVVDGRRHA